jgi:hypothetical protein
MDDLLFEQTLEVKSEKDIPSSFVHSEEFVNPWQMDSVSDYLYYCCAECDFKEKNEETFVSHATLYHPKSRHIFFTNQSPSPLNYEEEESLESRGSILIKNNEEIS